MRGIHKSFAGRQVLHDVDFDVRAGEVHALVGHNGAGKTTLMKILCGLHDYSGSITAPSTVAMIHQEFALVPRFTVAENIALGRERRWLLDRRRIRRDASELLDRLGFALPLDVPVRRLGVAAQQLTEIARAVARDAGFLVMDEPTARLPRAERQLVFDAIRQLTEHGVGVVYISHFLDEIPQVADRTTVLRDGRVVTTRPSAELDVPTLTGLIMGHEPTGPPADTHDLTGDVLRLEDFAPVGRDGSTFGVRRGEIVGLAGLTGSGRTRLALAVAGAVPSTGRLVVDGKPRRFSSPADAVNAGVALVPEDRKQQGLVMTLGVADNILLGASVRLRDRREVAASAITRFGIHAAHPGQLVRELSGGNQQKVLLARAAVRGARLLVLDQPTAGVDIRAKQDIYRIIRELAAEGAGCLVVSDELEELIELCHRVAIIRSGRVVGHRTTADTTEADLLAAISGR